MESRKTALLVMDVQAGIVKRLDNPDEYLEKVRAVVDSAHKKHVPVFYIVVGFRPGFPEISNHNKSFSTIKQDAMSAMVEPKPVIEPTGDDIVVTKRRVSAFSGSDLEVLLRAQDIKHIVLAGISTSGVVLSTTREAADKDYQITILSDVCADMDAEAHRVLIEKILPRQAAVQNSEEWAAGLPK